jgi:hypothetical protein
MTIAQSADRLTRPLAPDDPVIWLDGDARRHPEATILRLTEREAIAADGDLRPHAPFELVVVLEVRSPFSLLVARGQFGTTARAYPPGVCVDSIARSPRSSERPVYRGFEDI